MIRLMADAICWRTARSGILRLAIATIVSSRYSASRGAVGVDGRQAAVVAGVHGLQHVERLFAADLADDDAVGPHTQGVDHEIALADRALAFDVRRPRLEAHHVALPQQQLGGVLDRDDALGVGDEAGQHVQQRRLAGAGAARDDDVEAAGDGGLQEVEHRLAERLAFDQVPAPSRVGAEPPNRQRRARRARAAG